MLLTAYLSSPRTRRILTSRPGQAGFSLIELVVVIAILGILIAIALPAFNNVRKDAQISQAKNSLVNIVKECAVSEVREKGTALTDATSARANLGAYKIWSVASISSAGAVTWGAEFTGTAPQANNTCMRVGAKYYDNNVASLNLPEFAIATTSTTGETVKGCAVGNAASGAYVEGCNLASGQTYGSW